MSNFVINKGQLNNIAVTVSERSRLVNPYFLFAFTNKFSNTTAFCSLQMSSTNDRFDLFEITETADPDNLNGEVFLIEGEWKYEIYESELQTLDPSATTERVLQRGQILVD